MAQDAKNLLEILKLQLAFLENGCCGRSFRTLWKATSIFQDLPTCLNCSDPKQAHSCNKCVLIAFVPPARRAETVPCHHIPLTRLGDSMESIAGWAGREQSEDIVKNWLREIKKLEEEHAAETSWR